jgi:mannose-6-phosphate isomerase-like protein (cupin superfamily)
MPIDVGKYTQSAKEDRRMSINLSKYVMTPGQGEVIDLGPPNAGKIVILVDPKNTGEMRFCMLIQVLDPGAVVPVHLHEREEQILFFYAGHGKATLDDKEMEVNPGTTVYVPRQVWHGITNTGVEPLYILETTSPPGPENAFRELGQIAATADKATLIAIAARYGARFKDE